jgi:hypothetical protein
MAPIPARVSFPTRRHDAKTRGQALTYWIQEHARSQTSFSIVSGIQRQILNRYMAGAYDLANMSQELVERLLSAMHMSDSDARAYFGIPEEALVRWRTFRAPPMGQGAGETTGPEERALSLAEGLKGEVTVTREAGKHLSVVVDPSITTGLVITRQGSSLWAVLLDGPEDRAIGEVQGGFRRMIVSG